MSRILPTVTLTFAGAAALLSLAIQHPALAQSAKLEVNQVPPHLLAAARAVGRLEQVTEAGVEVENGHVVFEIKGRTREGKVREVDLLTSGEVEEIEEEIAQNEVPAPVMQALQRWMPNFRPTKMERSERPIPGTAGASHMMYEFEGQHGGMEVDVEVAADGSRLLLVDDTRG